MDGTGDLRRRGGYLEARFHRRFDHPAGEVWRFLTEPGPLARWLTPGEIELRVDGRVKLDFIASGIPIDSRVKALEPLRLLEYSWSGLGEPERPVQWRLAPVGDGVALTLTLRIPVGEDAARACAGWDAHLEMLAAALEGVPINFPLEHFKARRSHYGALLEAEAA